MTRLLAPLAILLAASVATGQPHAAQHRARRAPRGDAPDLATLIQRLGHRDWQVREDATRALIAAGPAARQALRQATQSPDAEVRWRAAYALDHLADSLALRPPNLARALYRSAALARRRRDDHTVARRLYSEVVERFPETRWAAAARHQLSEMDGQPDRPAPLPQGELKHLVGQLASPVWQERQAASCRLVSLGEAARPALETAARNADAELAWRARRLLARLQAEDEPAPGPAQGGAPRLRLDFRHDAAPRALTAEGAGLGRLVDTLGSADADQVEAARELLLHIGQDAVEPLVRGLDRCDDVAAVEIMDLLQRLTGERLGFHPDRWKAWWRATRRRRD